MKRHALLVASLAVAVYLPSVFVGGFLHHDDDHYVTGSAAVKNFEVGRAFDPSASRTDLGEEFLPVRDLTYMIDARVFGVDSPRAFRATNLAWYAAACALAYLLLLEVTKNAAVSFLAAALFAVHPVHAESVAWIASRKDVVSGALGFAALLAHARGHLVLALPLALAAMLSKSTLLCLPLLVPLVERRLSWRVLPHAALAALVASVAVYVGKRTGIAHALPPGGYVSIFLTDAPIVVRYLAESFVPVGLRVCYEPPFHTSAEPIVLASLGVLAATGLAAALRPELRLGAAWFALALAPVLNVQPGSQWIADRYVFVPLLGVTLVLARAIVRIAARAPRVSVVLATGLLLALAALGMSRGLDFTSDERLFRDNLRWTPDDPIVHHQLAMGLRARAERARADGHVASVAPLAHAAELEELEAIRLAPLQRFALPDSWHVEVRVALAHCLALQEKFLEETRLTLDLLRFLDSKGDRRARKSAEAVATNALRNAKDETNPRDVLLMLEAAKGFAFARQPALAKAAALRVNRTAPALVERAVLDDPDLERALR